MCGSQYALALSAKYLGEKNVEVFTLCFCIITYYAIFTKIEGKRRLPVQYQPYLSVDKNILFFPRAIQMKNKRAYIIRFYLSNPILVQMKYPREAG